MAGINGIGGINPADAAKAYQRANKPEASGEGQADFGSTLQKYVDKVDASQKSGQAAIQDLLSGKTNEVMPVVAEVAKADLSFKLLMGVRNKVIEAYKQTMNMQV